MLAINKCLFVLLLLVFSSFALAAEVKNTPTIASFPVKMIETQSELTNFYKIDNDVYRSGQPNAKQMMELEQIGIRSILNLRNLHTDNDEARNTNLNLYLVRMNADRINDKVIIDALRILHTAPKPILVHCWHGSDRTGAVIAMYRIVFQGWDKEAAINELLQPQFGHHATIYKNIPRYIRQADIDYIKQEVLKN